MSIAISILSLIAALAALRYTYTIKMKHDKLSIMVNEQIIADKKQAKFDAKLIKSEDYKKHWIIKVQNTGKAAARNLYITGSPHIVFEDTKNKSFSIDILQPGQILEFITFPSFKDNQLAVMNFKWDDDFDRNRSTEYKIPLG